MLQIYYWACGLLDWGPLGSEACRILPSLSSFSYDNGYLAFSRIRQNYVNKLNTACNWIFVASWIYTIPHLIQPQTVSLQWPLSPAPGHWRLHYHCHHLPDVSNVWTYSEKKRCFKKLGPYTYIMQYLFFKLFSKYILLFIQFQIVVQYVFLWTITCINSQAL